MDSGVESKTEQIASVSRRPALAIKTSILVMLWVDLSSATAAVWSASGSGIDLDGDDLAVCADGDGLEGLLGEVNVADGSNDGGVWASNEGGQESFADTSGGSGDEVGGFGHDYEINIVKKIVGI